MWTTRKPFFYFISIVFSIQLVHCAKSIVPISKPNDAGESPLSCTIEGGCEDTASEAADDKDARIEEDSASGVTITDAKQNETSGSGGNQGGEEAGGGGEAGNGGTGGAISGGGGTEAGIGGSGIGGSATGGLIPIEYEPIVKAPEGYDTGCLNPSDCALYSVDCCQCGQYDGSNCYAMTATAQQKYREDVCEDVSCSDIGFEPNPTVFATCFEGNCSIVELLKMKEVVGCESHDDCILRYTDCCGCNFDDEDLFVSVSDSTAYAELVCDYDMNCDECDPRFPVEAVPYCDQGRCRVAIPTGYWGE